MPLLDDERQRIYEGEETLAIRERVLGPEHPDTLGSRSNLAAGYRAAGRDADSERLETEG